MKALSYSRPFLQRKKIMTLAKQIAHAMVYSALGNTEKSGRAARAQLEKIGAIAPKPQLARLLPDSGFQGVIDAIANQRSGR